MARNITLAFAGSGKVKQETVEALLDDFLGFGPKDADGFPEPSENEIRVIFPASAQHYNENLQRVVDWTEYADLPYDVVLAKNDRDDDIETLVSEAESVTEVPNVDKQIVDSLAEAKGEKFLVLLWDDEDEHCEILLDLALTADVPVKDLTAALDDLKFDDETEEDPTPEPEPAPEKPTRGRRGSRRGAAKDEDPEPEKEDEKPARGRRRAAKEEPLEEQEEELTDEVDEPAAEPEPEKVEEAPKRGRRATGAIVKEEDIPEARREALKAQAAEKQDVVPTQDGAVLSVDAAYLSGALQSIFLHLQAVDAANAFKNLSDPVESPVTALAREALEHVSLGVPAAAEEPEEEAKRGRGRPRKTPVEEETTGYLVNGDGVYRKAGRGRPKRGEKKVDLTAAEVADLQAKGLVLDDEA